MGNGLLTLIHQDAKYQDFFSKDEIVIYKNFNDLVRRLNFISIMIKKKINS